VSDKWTWRPLGDLFDIGSGKTMSAAARNGEDKIPFLRTSNVFWDRLDLSTLDEMAIPAHELPDKLVEAGDLLVCEGGEIGRAAIWDGSVTPMAFQNHLHRLRPKNGEVDPQFYVYFLQSAFTQLGIFEGAGNKTTIPNLSSGRLAALEIPHPPLEEQRAIAGALGAVRDAQKLNESALAMTSELKRAAMNGLFTKGLRNEPLKETAIGTMPESWNPRLIGELCEIWSGGTPRKSVPEYWQGDMPWVSGKDLKLPAIEDAIDHISEEGVSAGSRLAPEGAVLVLVRGMGLSKDLPVASITRPMAFNQDVKALVSRGEYSGWFLRAAIYAGKDRLLGQIVASAHGTMTLNLSDIEGMMIACPSEPEEADEIVQVLDSMEQKIKLHRDRRRVLGEMFESLLLRVMTGEVTAGDFVPVALPQPPAGVA
jgi:type I restriction enzyme, S subunit